MDTGEINIRIQNVFKQVNRRYISRYPSVKKRIALPYQWPREIALPQRQLPLRQMLQLKQISQGSLM
jgi:hypothetical protein